ncbi:MAG TPA: MBL fold metallo-hydrolase [Vicinamibacterales bacterium]|nr:MBL fold metallo-hydrolase [Vicinamibacterales bacterium]
MKKLSALSAALVLAISAPAVAQERTAYPEKRGFKLSEFPRVVKLADNVYGYEDIRQPGFTTVSLFVVGNDGVLIADGQGNAAATQKLLDAIAKITPKPVKWYIVGSDHGDHTAGNTVLPKDITYIVTKTSRDQMKLEGPAMMGERHTVNVGGIEVQAIFAGRAHTGGDLLVYLPKQRILFMSEVYLNRVFPAMRSAYPSEWVAVIDKALAMNVERYVPGHGFIEEPAASREELIEYRKALRYVIDEVKRLHTLGLTADQAAKQANWGPYKDWLLVDQQGPIAVRKIYEEIEGKLK